MKTIHIIKKYMTSYRKVPVSRCAPFRQGFTIVETLVAITILMIAIAGPLVVATRSLTSAGAAKNQMIASFLAQESIEIIKNRRDNGPNFGDQDTGWLTVLDKDGTSGFDLDSCINDSATYPCDASFLLPNNYFYKCTVDRSPVTNEFTCRLDFDESIGYSPDPDFAEPSPFYRKFYIDLPKDRAVHPEEVTVHVVVDWLEGKVPYQTQISAQLVNVER